MGEKTQEGPKLQFHKRLRLEFHGDKTTLDSGLQACLTVSCPGHIIVANSGQVRVLPHCELKWEMSAKLSMIACGRSFPVAQTGR